MSLEAELRQLIAEGEEALRDDGWRGQGKEALMPQYRMLLRMLPRSRPVTETRIDDWLRVVRALREQSQLARLPGESDVKDAETLLDSPLAVLSARLRRLPDHVLLAVEPGADSLSWCALRGGASPLIERAALGISSTDGIRAIEQLISRHYDDVERLQSDSPIDEVLFSPMLSAAQNAWNTLPAGIPELLASARTVLYWASPSGSLGNLPLELLHNGTQWLGISHAVGRIASWRTLMEMLSPNRMPLSLTPSACIVRARDVAGAANLGRADQEIAAVEFHLAQRGMTADVDRAPTVAAVRDAFDAGLAALHVLGHGIASSMGEYLSITSTEMLRPQDLSELSGARSPFVYLSTCELGRSRAGRSGGALGFVARMLEKGVPAAIGCIQPVNDEVALEMARAVYRRPAAMRVSEALAQARQELDSGGYPPATWGAYVLFGDPNLIVPSAANPLQQSRHLTRDWCADVSRWAALRSDEALSRACAALASGDEGIDALSASDRAFVVAWLGSSAEAQSGAAYLERDEFCDRIAGHDPLAGAALRVLLAIEAVDGVYARAKPHFVLASPVAELVRALQAAQATHDMIAVPALAIRLADAAPHNTAGSRLQAQRLLDEAEGTLSGWVSEEPGAARLLDSLRAVRARAWSSP